MLSLKKKSIVTCDWSFYIFIKHKENIKSQMRKDRPVQNMQKTLNGLEQ